MNIRPFDWRDLPTLHRYRRQCVFLDSTRALTRGALFVPAGALLSSFSAATGFYTYLYQSDEPEQPPCFAQVSHTNGMSSAQMTFLAPDFALPQTPLSPLIEHLLTPVGERGALHLLAEVEDGAPAQDMLRGSGFGTYARQRIWRLDTAPAPGGLPGVWRSAGREDDAAVRFLYASLTPALVQQAESIAHGRLHGLVYYRGAELQAYIDLEYGLNGIYAQPLIHPDAEGIAGYLVQLLRNLPDSHNRPIYLRVRSYQSWLESILERFEAQPGPYQAVMVRRLSVRHSIPAAANVTPALGRVTEAPAQNLGPVQNGSAFRKLIRKWYDRRRTSSHHG